MPDLSIIIPTFEGRTTLRRTLDSIVKSVAESERGDGASLGVEIVVSLDGESRLVRSEVETWSETRGHAVEMVVGPRAGPSAARNRGAAISRADHLTFLDDDDELTPQRLKSEHRRVDFSLTMGEQRVMGGGDVPMPKQFGAVHQPKGASQPGAYCFISFVTTKQTFLALEGFDESLQHAEDFDFLIRAQRAGCTLHWIPEPFLLRHFTGVNHSLSLRSNSADLLAVLRKQSRT